MIRSAARKVADLVGSCWPWYRKVFGSRWTFRSGRWVRSDDCPAIANAAMYLEEEVESMGPICYDNTLFVSRQRFVFSQRIRRIKRCYCEVWSK